MDRFPELPARYRAIFCDLWGCVHDGFRLFPGVVERLEGWKGEGRSVLFLTNAPRSPQAVERGLAELGMPNQAYDGVLTAGEVGVAALRGRSVGFVGTAADRQDLVGCGLVPVEQGYGELACAGLTEDRPRVEDFADELAQWRERQVVLHCLNPDRVVIHGGERMVCAGALADAYLELGGTVHWYGKPYPDIYAQALRLAGNPHPSEVLAIGDGLATDMLGAARQGIDAVYVASGIHAGEPIPLSFAAEHALGDWQPIATVTSIGT
jgi:HAD superfamily hydrolase (TIGR01459 family)